MPRTLSEKLFEQFCRDKDIRCKQVEVGRCRTPDYDIYLPRRKVVTEVKEIIPNPTERAAEVALRQGRYIWVSITPGDRVRGKIADAAPQIKARAQYRYPGLLVLFANGLLTRHLDSYQIRVAMYGLETVVVAVPRNPRETPYAIGRKYGPRRKMTPLHNTSVSAVGVLSIPENGGIDLIVYHNEHAAQPLRPELFHRYGIRQFKLEHVQPGEIAGWEQIDAQ
jgi:hypothetical protein